MKIRTRPLLQIVAGVYRSSRLFTLHYSLLYSTLSKASRIYATNFRFVISMFTRSAITTTTSAITRSSIKWRSTTKKYRFNKYITLNVTTINRLKMVYRFARVINTKQNNVYHYRPTGWSIWVCEKASRKTFRGIVFHGERNLPCSAVFCMLVAHHTAWMGLRSYVVVVRDMWN